MIDRRTFLALPLASSFPLAWGDTSSAHHFQHDHVLGTSLDLAVWSTTPGGAARVDESVLAEIERLRRVLSTRDPSSEISRFEQAAGEPSPDLRAVLRRYEAWRLRTDGLLSLRPEGPGARMNVDALGKAYIADRAAAAGWQASRHVHRLVLNIGGDIVVRGGSHDIAIADPGLPFDNVPAVGRVSVRDAAVATSGPSARGAHLLDARTGRAPSRTASATVVAPDLVTANALATVLCVADADTGMAMVERTAGAAACRFSPVDGFHRSSGFAALTRDAPVQAGTSPSAWPPGYQLTISFTLPNLGPRSLRPFLAAWVEDEAGKLVKIITLWGLKQEWYKELATFWGMTGGNQALLFPVTRPTRSPGKYRLMWDGRDTAGNPVRMGTYRVVVEVNRERGEYTKRSAMIACAEAPSAAQIDSTVNWDELSIQYGPKAG